ncbi:general transcription factor 3C polypeptide 6 isoform X2 [Scyliorhinus canicula]|uniref:general transcription factor 3C polypeptide 6 isoform X2 n=1 Tax=Scyliorhinus canicula TaxID=7830 RepID=UPI0018F5E1A5|nr:general transcription factor 3C polypeptide 6 isoform X2 [Scyliorhinus canicula]
MLFVSGLVALTGGVDAARLMLRRARKASIRIRLEVRFGDRLAVLAERSGGKMAAGMVPVPQDGGWEEEEQLVVVELSGIIDPDFLLKCRNECKIVGIDTEQPVMQVDKCVFAGEYEDVLGTCVIFEETCEPDSELEDKPLLKYKCHTAKKLLMKRTFLSEKKEGEESTGGVEYLKIKENNFTRRSGLICNFLPNRRSSKGDGGAETSKEALDPLVVQDKELSNASSGTEGEASDQESADRSRELENITDENPGADCRMKPDADDSVIELGVQGSKGEDKK